MKKNFTIRDLGERKIISQIRHRLGNKFIGDDCAILPKTKSGEVFLATTDVLVEGIHFWKNSAWRAVGFKAIAVNVSDIASMAGEPLYALVSLGLKADLNFQNIQQLYQGLKNSADFYGLKIVGGNISQSPVNFIDVFMLGRSTGATILKRNTARPGDKLFLTGYLGKAAAKNYRITSSDFKKIRLAEGIFMGQNKLARACIDLSDGLAAGLIDLCNESKVGAVINTEKIPMAKKINLENALKSGDDFELLFCVPAGLAELAKKKFKEKFKTKLTEIGQITCERKIKYTSGSKKILKIKTAGYQHFW